MLMLEYKNRVSFSIGFARQGGSACGSLVLGRPPRNQCSQNLKERKCLIMCLGKEKIQCRSGSELPCGMLVISSLR